MPASLPHLERQKSQNSFVLTLGPHGAAFQDVIGGFHPGMKALDRGCQLFVNGKKAWVWAPILAFLEDMKQQQKSAGFLRSKALRCCRFCDADKRNRGDLTRDVVLNGRYHHQVLHLRREAFFRFR